MSDSKFDGIEDLTEVKYDPADPYKHRRKKIPCKFCPKSISSRNMSTHVKTVHADDNQIHSIKNSTRCSKKFLVYIEFCQMQNKDKTPRFQKPKKLTTTTIAFARNVSKVELIHIRKKMQSQRRKMLKRWTKLLKRLK